MGVSATREMIDEMLASSVWDGRWEWKPAHRPVRLRIAPSCVFRLVAGGPQVRSVGGSRLSVLQLDIKTVFSFSFFPGSKMLEIPA